MKYQLMSTNEEVTNGKTEQISIEKLQGLSIQKQTAFLMQNGRAVKGSIKVTKYGRKFSMVWQSTKTKLFHQQSYLPFVKNGEIRVAGQGTATVSKEAPETA